MGEYMAYTSRAAVVWQKIQRASRDGWTQEQLDGVVSGLRGLHEYEQRYVLRSMCLFDLFVIEQGLNDLPLNEEAVRVKVSLVFEPA